MKITITINTENAAFDDNAAPEVNRILKKLQNRFTNTGFEDRAIMDVNGNTVGNVEVTP